MKKGIVLAAFLLKAFLALSQKVNWQNLDAERDSIFGISTVKAYQLLLKGMKPNPVVVAVIDNGIDTLHDYLKGKIWRNKNEIPGNGIDDDHNGYVDDVYGWNFIGQEVGLEDVTYLACMEKDFYDSLSYVKIPLEYQSAYRSWRKKWEEFNGHIFNAQQFLKKSTEVRNLVGELINNIGKVSPTVDDFKNYTPKNDLEKQLRFAIINQLPKYSSFAEFQQHEIDNIIANIEFHYFHGLNSNISDKDSVTGRVLRKQVSGVGDNDVTGPFILPLDLPGPLHGTHVSGIIAGKKDEKSGSEGICGSVEIMPLRVMSFYRELRDIDLAMAIRYAADNGAKIISLSFGKYYTYNKSMVDDAVKYAISKDILIIHGAGNAGVDIDSKEYTFFPNKQYDNNGGIAKEWITVGASGWRDDSTLIAPFSNYGKKNVDVFAPGLYIYSSTPMNCFRFESGTSMATPVVSGLAALIRSYYPKLNARQVKSVILSSVVRPKHTVLIGKGDDRRSVYLEDICVSGGVVNAYNALVLASRCK